jgi:TetR/AcrR family transcriptional repressor of mexJK operon
MPSQDDQTTLRIPTGERAAQKRRAILAAARTVFMRDGFGVGLDVIAAEADVSKVTIYNHFGSKDQLFAEVIGSSLEDALTAAITGAEARLGAGDDLREALVWIVQAWIDGLTTPDVLALRHLMLREMERFPELGLVWREYGPDRARSDLAAAFTRCIDAGRLDIPDLEAAVYQLYSLALYPHLIHATYGTKLAPELSQKLVTSGVDMFLTYYRYQEAS